MDVERRWESTVYASTGEKTRIEAITFVLWVQNGGFFKVVFREVCSQVFQTDIKAISCRT
jgi:hypothetical protein